MNNPRLSKSGIEYLDYSWGIFSGCHNHLRGICGGGGREFHCWARGIAYRFPNHYPDSFNPHYYPEALDSPKHLKKPSIIGVGWVGDVIGYGLKYKEQIFSTIRACPQHRFLFLTKNPQQLINWSPFPETCYVGVTVTGPEMYREARKALPQIKASVIYLSIEPFLENIPISAMGLKRANVNGVIIGAQTKPYKPPKIEWVREIVDAADKAGIPVFLKDNLKPLIKAEGMSKGQWAAREWVMCEYPVLRQEMPEEN